MRRWESFCFKRTAGNIGGETASRTLHYTDVLYLSSPRSYLEEFLSLYNPRYSENHRNMSVRLPNLAVCADDDSGSQSGSSSEDDQDQSWDDFAEESIAQQACLSLFESKQFPSVTEALEYDRKQHKFDLDGICSHLCASSFKFAVN